MIEHSFNNYTEETTMTPHTKEHFAQLRFSSQANIMEAALELFTKHGFHKTTIKMIAERAGVSTGLMYNYFTSKDELLLVMIRKAIEMGERGLDKSREIKNPVDHLKASIGALKGMRGEWNSRLSKLIHIIQIQPDSHPELNILLKQFHLKVNSLLEEKFRELGVKSPDLEARLLPAMLTGIKLDYLLLGDDYPLDEIIDLIIEKYSQIK